jgi:hypothetical protein
VQEYAEWVLRRLDEANVHTARQIATLEGENRELKGMLGATLQLIRKFDTVPDKSAEVIGDVA